MTAPMYLVDGSPLRDPIFTAVISERMRVPERLQVTQSAVEDLKARAEDLPAAFSMHVPDRLALTDAPDLSPRPHFSQHVPRGHAFSKRNLRQEPWDGDATSRGLIQSPLRRSYSDQTFGRTLSGTPGRSKHGPSAAQDQARWYSRAIKDQSRAHVAKFLSFMKATSRGGHSAGTMPPVPKDSPLPALPQGLSAITPVLLSPQSVLQVARKLGKQASNRILQTVAQKYSSRFGFPEKPSPQPVEDRADQALKSSTTQEFWRNPEEESGTTVELMVLRRQMMKMNRRITSLEKQNADRRQSEVLLLSLLLSACVINGWLWIRK